MQPSDHTTTQDTRFEVMEFYGDGDPMFGGTADDRMLCTDGLFYRSAETHPPVARFPDRDTALASGNDAANKRDGALISAFPIEPAPSVSTLMTLTGGPDWGAGNSKR